MPSSIQQAIFSLSRFFHGTKKKLPCWLAGRFYPKNHRNFELKSQNLSLTCQFKKLKPKIQTGSWIAVLLHSQKKNIYLASEYKILSSPELAFKNTEDSYKNKGLVLQDWSAFLDALKEFFYSKGYAYVETPSLVNSPGTEPHLNVFKTSLMSEEGSKDMYLPTSPEIHLKKLLCQDWTDFFEIKKCYRNGEIGKFHQAEFYLLECYRAFYSTKELIEDIYHLICFLKTKTFFKSPLPQKKIYSLKELFQKELNFSLTPQSSKKELYSLIKKYKLNARPDDSFEDLFFLLFLNFIEPKLSKKDAVFICNYPPQMRAFSQLNKEGWADRFELYWKGLELANAFYEVTDPKEQLSLFQKHISQRKDPLPIDQELISMMKGGMPPTSGIAIGLDRLFLALYKKEDLNQTRLFPLKQNIENPRS